MTSGYTSFVILAGMRTGSNFLEANLNAVPGLVSYGELFNPAFLGKVKQPDLFGWDMAARDAQPLAFLAHVRAETPGMAGFRLFDGHDPRVLNAVLDDPACAKIVLARDPLESFVSWLIARETGQWKLSDARALRQGKVRFDVERFELWLAEVQDFHHQIRHRLQVTGQTGFVLDYEDLGDIGVLNGLLSWLGLSARLEKLDSSVKKQNPEPLTEKLTNPEALEQAAARLDLFQLARTPLFEPRRMVLPKGFVGLRRLPLLFMPIPGAPDVAVADWMAGLLRGGVETGFNRWTLKRWQASHPGARAFTVLRHPLLRAWSAWQLLLSGEMPAYAKAVEKTLKCTLPSPEADIGAQRDGFLAFLRYAKMNLAAQTALRVPASWASQTAFLQSYAEFQPPELILREEDLGRGLAYLATAVGARRRPGYTPRPMDLPRLSALLDADIHQAARAAWARDYQTFGFADWTAPQAA